MGDTRVRFVGFLVPAATLPGLPLRIQVPVSTMLTLSIAWLACGVTWATQDDPCYKDRFSLQASWLGMTISIIVHVVVSQLCATALCALLRRLGLALPLGSDRWYPDRDVLGSCTRLSGDADCFVGGGLPTACPICMMEFDAKVATLQTPCMHVFHSQCLKTWSKRSHSCPMCRADLKGGTSKGGPSIDGVGRMLVRGQITKGQVDAIQSQLELAVRIAELEAWALRREQHSEVSETQAAEFSEELEGLRRTLNERLSQFPLPLCIMPSSNSDRARME